MYSIELLDAGGVGSGKYHECQIFFHHEWDSIQRSCFKSHEWWKKIWHEWYFHTADKPPVLSSCITVEWILTERVIFQYWMIFMLFSNILGNGNFCSEIEASTQRKEKKRFWRRQSCQNTPLLTPTGWLTLSRVVASSQTHWKNPNSSACWRLWHGLHPLSPFHLGNFEGFILPVSLHKLPGGLSFMDLGSSARNKFGNRIDF